MRGAFHSGLASPRSRRAEEAARPIASSLKLGEEHIHVIDQSHLRCVALGVSRIERPDHSPLGRSDFTVVRDRNRRLFDHAAPVMEMLHGQIINSQSMVVLTDATGTILHSTGDDEFLARASKVALQPGANWSESAKGTNAIGTALIEEVPTLVHADEHYLHANHFLTCSATPILDPRGNMLGVLDVTGDHRGYHQHTMALVTMSARMIENHWLTEEDRNAMRLHFHSRVEFIGTLMEGILAINADGRIVGANRGALEQLGLSGAALRAQSLVSLFGTTVSALVDRFRTPLATPLPVHSPSGRTFHLHARFNWPVWTSLAEAVSAAPALLDAAVQRPEPVRAVVPEPGLARLRSGDAQMASAIDKVLRVIDRDIPILLLGETGTGKELLARAIHADSPRARKPFVVLSCASIPEASIKAEGAVGQLLQAHGGTLFLDEIGELSIAMQAHLLRLLQERQLTPLGATKPIPIDVSIICATQRNLREMIERKAFREDLFYRLNGLAVRLPPLRERSDRMALARGILERENPQRPLPLAPEVQRLVEHYSWPGNVRQLFNVLRTAAVMAAGQPMIRCEHLSDDFLEEARAAVSAGDAASKAPGAGINTGAAQETRPLQELEVEAIRRAVDSAGGNVSAAAKRLGISRNTIYRKLRWATPAAPD